MCLRFTAAPIPHLLVEIETKDEDIQEGNDVVLGCRTPPADSNKRLPKLVEITWTHNVT